MVILSLLLIQEVVGNSLGLEDKNTQQKSDWLSMIWIVLMAIKFQTNRRTFLISHDVLIRFVAFLEIGIHVTTLWSFYPFCWFKK